MLAPLLLAVLAVQQGGREPTAPAGGAWKGTCRAPPPFPRETTETPAWRSWWERNREAFVEHPIGTDSEERTTTRSGPLAADLAPTLEVLFRILENEKEPELVGAALLALAKIGALDEKTPPLVPRIARLLPHAAPELRRDAVVALGVLADEAGMAPLLELLADSERGRELVGGAVLDELRAFAAYGLARVAWYNPATASAVADGLRAALVRKNAPEFEVACVQALGLVPCAGAAEIERGELLLALADDAAHAPYARGQAALGLCRGFETLPPELVESWKQRVTAAELGWSASPQAPLPLRRQATLALGALSASVEPTLRVCLAAGLRSIATAEADATLAGYALLALAASTRAIPAEQPELAAELAAFLVAALDGPSARRPWAALACGRMVWALSHPPRASGRFAETLMSLRSAMNTRLHAASGKESAFVVGARLAADEEGFAWATRELRTARPFEERTVELVDWLGSCPNTPHDAAAAREALGELMARSRRESELYRRIAAARSRLDDRALTGELVGELRDADTFLRRVTVLYALGVTEDKKSLEAALGVARDVSFDMRVRAYAVWAVGELGDKEARPWNAAFARDLDPLDAPETLCGPKGVGLLDYR
ncbi:MAG: hypothetical protein EXS08_06855 [Planctomycetes bacterium]|nr:hypothetical protein [Planctomycetota bacterium]